MRRGSLSKIRKRTSIIGHTVTCPHCGHRTLPENLRDHIQRIHPAEFSEEKYFKKLDFKPKRSMCPHCKAVIAIGALEEHIRNLHPDVIQQVDRFLNNSEKVRELKKISSIKRRTGVNNIVFIDEVKELDPDAPMEWRLAQKKPVNKVIGTKLSFESREFRTCPYCKSKIRAAKYQKHIDTVHKKATENQFDIILKASPALNSQGLVKCPVCEVMLKNKMRLEKHLVKTHSVNQNKLSSPNTLTNVNSQSQQRPKAQKAPAKFEIPAWAVDPNITSCPDCHIRFNNHKRLITHVLRIHKKKL